MVGRLRVKQITNETDTGAPEVPFGVKFTNTLSSDSKTLDWYEEGIWTPVVTGMSSAGVATYGGTRRGKFVRVGNLVTVEGRVQWTAHTGTGWVQLTGLPYPGSVDCMIPIGAAATGNAIWWYQGATVYIQNGLAGFTGMSIGVAGDLIINGSYIAG